MTRKNFWPAIPIAGLCSFIPIVSIIVNSTMPPPITYQPWIIGTVDVTDVEGVFTETLTLPVNTSQDVLTAHRYAGDVMISICGEGRIDENTTHSAFYKYTTGKSAEDFFGFFIDGKNIVPAFSGSSLEWDPNYGYRLLYHVGDEFRQIAFRMVNGNERDTSEFTIEVSTENQVSSGGR